MKGNTYYAISAEQLLIEAQAVLDEHVMGLPRVPPQSLVPSTPVVGYVRAEALDVVEWLRGTLDDYAQRAGLVVADVYAESPGATGTALPAFARCIETVRREIVRGIIVPTWAHLAPDGVLGAALLRAAREADAPLYGADQSVTPWWGVDEAARAHQVHADQRAAASGPAHRGDLR